MRRLLIFASFLIAGLCGQAANAIIIDGQFVPDELWNNEDNRGVAQYRVLIVTDDPFAAANMVLSDFDAIVKGEADRAGSIVSGLTWEAIVSASDGSSVVSAASRADGAGVEVYSTKGGVGEWLSSDYADLFSPATPLGASREYNQFGLTEGSALMWSGSNDAGGAAAHLGQSATTLGTWGVSQTKYDKWLDSGASAALGFAQSQQMRYYGISEVLTVPIPEPATCVMWLTFSGIVGLAFWRKRRKSS